MKKNFLLFLLFLLIVPTITYAQLNLNYPEFGGINLGEGNLTFVKFVTWLYYAIIVFASAAAFGIIVWGGIEYLTSAGNSSRMQSGLGKIKDAVIGLLIILLSYMVLQTINPELTELPDLDPSPGGQIINFYGYLN